mmetsp:Transcript_119447/g.168012  ORF Transcript_119447/g.168012 Transcript_119447/m.168012 type:complete len:317 (-) Transcript_119447:54-1004(-)
MPKRVLQYVHEMRPDRFPGQNLKASEAEIGSQAPPCSDVTSKMLLLRPEELGNPRARLRRRLWSSLFAGLLVVGDSLSGDGVLLELAIFLGIILLDLGVGRLLLGADFRAPNLIHLTLQIFHLRSLNLALFVLLLFLLRLAFLLRVLLALLLDLALLRLTLLILPLALLRLLALLGLLLLLRARTLTACLTRCSRAWCEQGLKSCEARGHGVHEDIAVLVAVVANLQSRCSARCFNLLDHSVALALSDTSKQLALLLFLKSLISLLLQQSLLLDLQILDLRFAQGVPAQGVAAFELGANISKRFLHGRGHLNSSRP